MDDEIADLLAALSTTNKVTSRIEVDSGSQALVLNLTGLPHKISTCVLHRKLSSISSALLSDDVPTCSKVTEYFLLDMNGSSNKEFVIPLANSDAFNTDDFSLKGCSKTVPSSQPATNIGTYVAH